MSKHRQFCAANHRFGRAPIVSAFLVTLASAAPSRVHACDAQLVQARAEPLIAASLRRSEQAKNEIVGAHADIGRVYGNVLDLVAAWIRVEQFSPLATDDLEKRIAAALDFADTIPRSDDEIVNEAVYDLGWASRVELDFRSRHASMIMTQRVLGPNAGGDPLAPLETALRARTDQLKTYAAWIEWLDDQGCSAGADLARAWAYLAFAYPPEDMLAGGLAPQTGDEPTPDSEEYWRAYSAFGIDRRPLWEGSTSVWWMMLRSGVPVEWPGAEAQAAERARIAAAVVGRLEAEPPLRDVVGPLPPYPAARSTTRARAFDPFAEEEPPPYVPPPL